MQPYDSLPIIAMPPAIKLAVRADFACRGSLAAHGAPPLVRPAQAREHERRGGGHALQGAVVTVGVPVVCRGAIPVREGPARPCLPNPCGR